MSVLRNGLEVKSLAHAVAWRIGNILSSQLPFGVLFEGYAIASRLALVVLAEIDALAPATATDSAARVACAGPCAAERGSGQPAAGVTTAGARVRRTAPLEQAAEQKAEAPTRSGGRSARQWWHTACTKRSRGAKAIARSNSTSSPAAISRVAMAHRPRLRARRRRQASAAGSAAAGRVPRQRLYRPRQVRSDALEGGQRRAGRRLALLRAGAGVSGTSRAPRCAASRLLLLLALARRSGAGRGVGARRLLALGRLVRPLRLVRLHLRRGAGEEARAQ